MAMRVKELLTAAIIVSRMVGFAGRQCTDIYSWLPNNRGADIQDRGGTDIFSSHVRSGARRPYL
jgi:hypothetical protein